MLSVYVKGIVVLVSACLLSVAATAARAGEDESLSPYFSIAAEEGRAEQFPLKATDVKVTINGVIADVVVVQQYTNTSTEPINGSYIFPASTRAAVHGMSMTVNDDVIRAQIKEKEEAKQTFEQAMQQGKSASLLTQQRPNVFSMDVANIMPGDTITMELNYTELLVPTDNIYQFVYPTVVGPRYSSQTVAEASPSDLWVQNPYLKPGTDPQTRFSMEVTLSTGLDLQDLVCTSHPVKTEYQGSSLATITLKEGEPFGGDRDFILNYRLADERIATGLMLFEKEQEKFFLLMVQPPEKVEQADIPAREYIFVVDVSGSMNGFPLNTAKKLLRGLIDKLRPTDRFNVLLFAGSSHLLSPVSLPATRENLDKALQVIDTTRGGGGTELLSAVRRGMELEREENVSRTMVLVTDGYISAEKEVFQEIGKNLGHTNVFAFGIGSSVNRYLVEGVARAGGGEPFVVTKPEEAARASEKFRSYIDSPVLTGITIDYDGFKPYDIEPQTNSDLFAMRPLVILGKYHGAPEGVVTISGVSGGGSFKQSVAVGESGSMLEVNKALPWLWARKRLQSLSDYNLGEDSGDTRSAIVSLGLTYNLLSKYTSFVAVHEQVRNTSGPATDVKQPLVLPKNVSPLAVSGSMKKVPEPALYPLMLVVLALAAHRFRQSCRTHCPASGKA